MQGQGGYGYGGYQQGYDYMAQQQAMHQQQQQWYAQQQQGYPQQQQQQQQQWGGGQYEGYGQQQQQPMQEQRRSQQGVGASAYLPPHMRGSQGEDQGKGAKGGTFGKGAGAAGGGKGGGGKSGEMTLEEYQQQRAEAKKQAQAQPKKQGGGELSFEEYQAQQAARKAQKAAGGPPKIQLRAKELDEAKPPQKEEVPPAAAKPAEDPEPAADDWEDEVDSSPLAKEEVAPVVNEETPAVKEEPPAKEEKEEPKAADPPVEVAAETPAAERADDFLEEGGEVEEETAKTNGAEDGKRQEPDPRAHLNVVFIGHVDAGKSTTCGNVLYLSGCVDERSIEKYQKEARDKNRESWFLAYIMDTSEEEKAKGKTVEVGRAHFETVNRRWTILDAPGHKSYVPNMISGASQADIGVLIISARKGEFETGFERGGQTREHALLAKTLGVDKLVVAINKMDDASVEWAQSRYDDIVKKLAPFLKQSGFKDDTVIFLPISGLVGDNVKERKNTPDWVTGKTLLDLLDSLEVSRRDTTLPIRIPMLDGYRDMGAVTATGKVEQGTVAPGTKCVIMPIGHKCTITSVFINDVEMQYARCGENVTLKMHGCSEEQLNKGFVLCPVIHPVRVVTKFKALLQLIELPEERPVLTSGYKAVIHIHVACEECEILKLYECTSLKDKKKEKNPNFCRENSAVICSIQINRPTAVDVFSGVAQLGRFTLRDEGKTIAIGKVTELPNPDKDGKK